MIAIKGISVSKGIAFGNIVFKEKNTAKISKNNDIDSDEEISRFLRASADTFNHLQYLYEKTLHNASEEYAKIFSIQQMMLQDDDYVETIINSIKEQNINAEYAVFQASEEFQGFFLKMESEAIRSKAKDIKDISEHIIRHLNKEKVKTKIYPGGRQIIVSDTFLPSEVADIDKNIVSALIATNGLARSHAAYLARQMQIPAVINTGVYMDKSLSGKPVALNAFTGEIFIEPDELTIDFLKNRQVKYSKIKKMIGVVKNKMSLAAKNGKVQMIALDLDGTIINNGNIISDKSIDTIKKAAEQGIVVAVCTGRVLMEIPDEVKQMSGIQYFITSNGAAIYDNKFVCVYEDPIPKAVADKAIEILDDYVCLLDLYVGGNGYVQSENIDNINRYKIDSGFIPVFMNSRVRVDDIHEFYNTQNPDIEKINLFFADLDERREAIARLGQLMPPPNVTYSMGNNLEINSSTCCKGQGVCFLSRKLGIEPENIMTIGDSNNDISMLEYAGFSVAMGNAPDSVKSSAKYVTDTCENDGAAKAIEKYALA